MPVSEEDQAHVTIFLVGLGFFGIFVALQYMIGVFTAIAITIALFICCFIFWVKYENAKIEREVKAEREKAAKAKSVEAKAVVAEAKRETKRLQRRWRRRR